MHNASADVVAIEEGGGDLWRISLRVSVPAGTEGLEPDFLYKLGRQPQTTGILVVNAPEPMVVTVQGKPWVKVGDHVPIGPQPFTGEAARAHPSLASALQRLWWWLAGKHSRACR